MPENDIPVVRIVVKGCPSTRSEETNIQRVPQHAAAGIQGQSLAWKCIVRGYAGRLCQGAVSRIVGMGNADGRPAQKTSGHLSRTPGRPWMKC